MNDNNNNNKLKTTPTYMLISVLDQAVQNQEQDIINLVAWELANRIWIPNDKITLEEMAIEFGYVKTNELEKEPDTKQKKIGK